MREGLRALPWLQDARRKEATLLDCATCRDVHAEPIRKAMGCGWLASSPDAQPWQHIGDDGAPYTTCPGYTTDLPDVVDTVRAWLHWDKGQLGVALGNKEPSPALLDAIELFASAIGGFRDWKATDKS